jgi:predicted outer membrane protein
MRHHFKHRAAMLAALAVSVIGGTAAASEVVDHAHRGGQHGQLQVRQQRRALQQRALQQRARQQQEVSDGALAGVISGFNRYVISMETVARKQARTREIRDFARETIASHSQSERRLSALLQRLGIKAQPTRASAMLSGHSSMVASFLSKQSPRDFDRVYLATEIKSHRFILRLLDEQLIPKVKNEALKEEFQRYRREVEDHLAHALALQAKRQAAPPSQGR